MERLQIREPSTGPTILVRRTPADDGTKGTIDRGNWAPEMLGADAWRWGLRTYIMLGPGVKGS